MDAVLLWTQGRLGDTLKPRLVASSAMAYRMHWTDALIKKDPLEHSSPLSLPPPLT